MTRARDPQTEELLTHSEKLGEFAATFDPALRHNLRYRIERGEVIKPAPGVYARKSCWESLSKRERAYRTIAALQRIHPTWTFCHNSAAVALGLPIALDDLDSVHIAVDPAQRGRSTKGVIRHVVENDRPIVVRGIRTTSLERTVFDCMRIADFGMAVAISDYVLRQSEISKALRGKAKQSRDRYLAYFSSLGMRKLKGARRASIAMLYADPRSESVGESLARATMIEMGFALPDLQRTLPHPLDPGKTFRVDFCWLREDGMRIIGEFDGAVKYENPETRGGVSALKVLEEERRRESLLSVYGMPIVRFSYKDVMNKGYFARLLRRFGVPEREEMAKAFRRIATGGVPSALTFSLAEY